MEDKEEFKSFYRRGSGLRVNICHESDDQARFLCDTNRTAGYEILRDDKGFLFVQVCKYDTCYRSK